jgi:uncharacterized protein (DUF1501 family)
MSTERLTKRRSLLAITDRKFRIQSPRQDFTDMDQLMENASKMVTSSEVQAAFDLSQETEATRDAYGRNGVGKAALLARRLVEAGARFVTARGHRDNAWDTHSKNDDGHKKDLTPPFDQALSALVEDLSQRGLWGATIVVAMGEFGRTPFHNSAGGRDHWPNCWSLVLGGGGLRGGQVIGSSDERGVRDGLQGTRDRLANRVSDSGWPTGENRQLLSRHNRYAHPRTRLTEFCHSITCR